MNKYFTLLVLDTFSTLSVPNTLVKKPCLELFSKKATCFNAAALKTISGLKFLKSLYNNSKFSIFVKTKSTLEKFLSFEIEFFNLNILYSPISRTIIFLTSNSNNFLTIPLPIDQLLQ